MKRNENAIYYKIMESVIGPLTLSADENALTQIGFGAIIPASGVEKDTPVLSMAVRQLTEYLEGKRKEFTVSLAPAGTDFQKKVWDALTRIPYGETRSYKEVAEMAGNGKACRAVGMANNRNPIPVIIPCHRVIGSDGSMVGYGGGLPIKQKLLSLEKR